MVCCGISSKGAECEAGPGNRRVPFRAPKPMAELDEIPVDQRAGDYFILRAQIWICGQNAEAADSLDRVFARPACRYVF